MNKDFVLKEVKKRDLPITKTPNNETNKVKEFKELLGSIGLFDGMTISFHHHLRAGDYVLNMVMEEIHKRGIKDITIFASSIFPCHAPLVSMIEDKTVTKIYAAYISGPVGEAITYGAMEEPVVMHTHGGRSRILQDGEITIDFAFIAAPTADSFGNFNGVEGKSACGALGYAYADAYYSKCAILLTDNLVDNVSKVDIEGKYINHVCPVETIGDATKIVSGTTQITKNPIGLKIARSARDVIKHSGFYKNGMSFQTGAGGISLAVADYLKDMMVEDDIKGSFAAGGITGYIVDMYKKGLFKEMWDCQCFDLDAVKSIKENDDHHPMSASKYASVYDDNMVDKLDFVILGATEIDTNFNVNVTTSSTGVIMGGSGGHSDTAYGANVTIIVSQLMNARISTVRNEVTTCTTPGETVDVFVSEYGIAVNPKRTDLIEKFKQANLNVKTIDELRDIAYGLTKEPKPIEFTDRVVGIVEYRDGQVIDYIYEKKKK